MPLPRLFSGLTNGKLNVAGLWALVSGFPAAGLGEDPTFVGEWIGSRILPGGSSDASA